jgi:thiosulfate oxidation carrier complex protein SoxZ
MESGQRRDSAGKPIPRKILNKFTCTVNGKQVFAADFEPAISANPYIQFKFRAEESGPVVLTWTDDDGSKIVGETRSRSSSRRVLDCAMAQFRKQSGRERGFRPLSRPRNDG